jgi:hypothetical protein
MTPDDRPWVFNLGTQEGYWRSRASYEAIGVALEAMRRQADAEGVNSIAMPRIGVGYGGLSWRKVRAIIESVFGEGVGTLVVSEEFVPGDPEPPRSGVQDADQRTSPADDGSGHPRSRSHEGVGWSWGPGPGIDGRATWVSSTSTA